SYTPVDSGMELEVRVYPLDPYSPIKVDKASVRWVTGRDFGLEFLNLEAGEQAQLQRFIGTLGESPKN
ncbi:MAG: PilZ domain-containing protein, partial [Nitrospirota bacterium]|nr:PilZ domain-containing protein [Nitrospirota bacterium]